MDIYAVVPQLDMSHIILRAGAMPPDLALLVTVCGSREGVVGAAVLLLTTHRPAR